MPKMKTNRSVAKRFKKTAGGLFKRNKAFRRHNTGKKSSKVKRALAVPGYADVTNTYALKVLMPT